MKISRKVFMASWATLIVGAAMFTDSAFAFDGSVNINGNVNEQSCRISINGGDFATGVLRLPTVAASSLSAVGAVAGSTPFTIVFVDCATDQGDGLVRAFFEAANVDQESGNLINTATGGATNVQVQITDASNQPINLANGGDDTGVPISEDGTATIAYNAQYISVEGGATAGTVATSLVFTTQYQ